MNHHRTYRTSDSLNSPWALSLKKRSCEPIQVTDAITDHLLRVHEAMFRFAGRNELAKNRWINRVCRERD